MESLLNKIMKGNSLTKEEAYRGMQILKKHEATPEQMGAFLCALHTKGESTEEIVGFVSALLDDAVPVILDNKNALDCCGTGGDGSHSFNISTTVGIVLAAGEVSIAKHGNRSISSLCGSADVLEALDLPIEFNAQQVNESINKNHFAFMFAPLFHPAIKSIAPIRKALGVRTVFNLLGPLLNPAKVKRQVMGVFDYRLNPLLASALKDLGSHEAMVVSSKDGLDEISLSDVTYVSHLKNGQITDYEITPEQVGLKRAPQEVLKGGDAKKNAEIIQSILRGEKGPCRDAVLINSSAGFLVGGKVSSLKEGVQLAAEVIDDGSAAKTLENLKVKK